jgi:phosphohistidine phosphatase SixA
VGHNPEMTELAQHFAPLAPDMATCAVAQLDFDIASWSEIDVGVPSRVVFDSPKKGRTSCGSCPE